MADKINERDLVWVLNTHITDGIYPIDGAYRVEPYTPEDSGWRLISVGDTREYMDNPANLVTMTLDEVVAIEPSLSLIKDLPVGTEIQLIQEEDDVRFVDYNTKSNIF
jgi:hypothetical protein